MSQKYMIHIDTASVSNVTSSFGSYGPQPCVTKLNGNPFQCQVILGNRHRRLRSVALKNAQIPIGFFNIRAPYNTLIIDNVTYTVLTGNYSITNLINAINSLITISVGEFAVDPLTNSITFTSSSGVPILSVTQPSLLYFLGFTDLQQGVSITATYSYIVNWDTYLNIWIENLGQSSLEPAQITYKVPLSVGSAGVQQYSEAATHVQKLDVTDRGVRLDRLNIEIQDRFGNILNNNGIDWSFTLEIEADT
jgi:hypothetical protein